MKVRNLPVIEGGNDATGALARIGDDWFIDLSGAISPDAPISAQ